MLRPIFCGFAPIYRPKKRPSRRKGVPRQRVRLFILGPAAIGRAQALVFPAAVLAAAADLDVVEIAANALMVVGAAHYIAADGLFFLHGQTSL